MGSHSNLKLINLWRVFFMWRKMRTFIAVKVFMEKVQFM